MDRLVDGNPPLLKLQPRLLHAALYTLVMYQTAREIFPDTSWLRLSSEQRRIVDNETMNILTFSRTRLETLRFARIFAEPSLDPAAPTGHELGTPPTPQEDTRRPPGQYA